MQLTHVGEDREPLLPPKLSAEMQETVLGRMNVHKSLHNVECLWRSHRSGLLTRDIDVAHPADNTAPLHTGLWSAWTAGRRAGRIHLDQQCLSSNL